MKSLFRRGGLLLALLLPALTGRAQTTVLDSIRSGGLWRSYRLYVPAGLPAGTPVPLLLNLHGYSSNAFEQENYGDFRPIADTAHFLVVHPNGSVNAGNRFWNAFGQAAPNDVAFLAALIDTISAQYAVDADRVYSTGMSNGGFMSYELACQLSGRIAAIASVTGTMAVPRINACRPTHPMPVLEIHGTADGTVPYNGTALFAGIPQVLDYWVQFNQCDTVPVVTAVPNRVTTDNCTAERLVWSNGRHGVPVEHYRILGGGHTWPGSPFIIGVTNQDIRASVEVWRFLRRYRLSGLVTATAPEPPAIDLTLTPNPADAGGWVTVRTGQPLRPAQLSATDVLGRSLPLTATAEADGTVRLDVRAWPAGVYVLRGTDGRRAWQRRLVK